MTDTNTIDNTQEAADIINCHLAAANKYFRDREYAKVAPKESFIEGIPHIEISPVPMGQVGLDMLKTLGKLAENKAITYGEYDNGGAKIHINLHNIDTLKVIEVPHPQYYGTAVQPKNNHDKEAAQLLSYYLQIRVAADKEAASESRGGLIIETLPTDYEDGMRFPTKAGKFILASLEGLQAAGAIQYKVEPSEGYQTVRIHVVDLEKLEEQVTQPDYVRALKKLTIGTEIKMVHTTDKPNLAVLTITPGGVSKEEKKVYHDALFRQLSDMQRSKILEFTVNDNHGFDVKILDKKPLLDMAGIPNFSPRFGQTPMVAKAKLLEAPSASR